MLTYLRRLKDRCEWICKTRKGFGRGERRSVEELRRRKGVLVVFDEIKNEVEEQGRVWGGGLGQGGERRGRHSDSV